MASKPKHPRTLLLINSWITDFAAFDLWSKPLGLLYLAGLLRQNGHSVRLIDWLDRYDPLKEGTTMRNSTGFVKCGMLFFAVILLTAMFFSAGRAKGFGTGDKVEVIHTAEKGLRVLDTACGDKIGGTLDSAVGMVLEGPIFCQDHNRWKIRWENGLEGWSAEKYLKRKDFALSPKFRIDDRIMVYNAGGYGLKVRTDPPQLAEKGKVYDDTTGTIKVGPFYGIAKGSSGFYPFWEVEYDNGTVGWCAEPWLKVGPDLKVDDTRTEPAKSDSGKTVEAFPESTGEDLPDLKVEVAPNNVVPESDERNNDVSSPFSARSPATWALFCFLGLGIFGAGYLFLISNMNRRLAKAMEGLEGRMEHLEEALSGTGGGEGGRSAPLRHETH